MAGITNYMRIEARNKTLEIGGTWVAPAFRRTEVNTRVKCALLKHAFEVLEAIRVEFRVDERNYASQMGVLRLGAVREARLRHRQIYPEGKVTDGFFYSIIQPEWPQTYGRLQALIARQPVREKLANRIPAERIVIEPYRLSDAAEFAELIAANREDLLESFPVSAVQVVNEGTAQGYIADVTHKAREGTAFFYGVRHEGRLIGQFQLKSVDWKAKSAEFAYFVDRRSRREGFAREMIEAGLREVFMNHGFNRVFVRVLPENMASAKLAQRMEFVDEGVMRSAFVSGSGQLKDIRVYSKVRT